MVEKKPATTFKKEGKSRGLARYVRAIIIEIFIFDYLDFRNPSQRQNLRSTYCGRSDALGWFRSSSLVLIISV